MEATTYPMPAPSRSITREVQQSSPEEHIMLYNLSSLLGINATVNSSPHNDSALNSGGIPFTTNFPLNTSFEEVTILRSLGRSPVRPEMPLSFMELLLKNVDAVVMPAAMSIGILGNLLVVLIFLLTPLRASALSHYLTALGISDLIYLLSCLSVWTTGRGINFHNTMGVCQITMFALLLSRFLATWYLFAAHAERVVVFFGTGRARKWCTTFRTKCIIIAISVFSLVGFSHYMWTHVVIEKKGKSVCLVMQESLKHLVELGKIEIITALFLPMLLIIVIDIAFLVSVIARWAKKLFSTGKSHKGKNCEWRGEYALAEEEISRSPSTRSGDSTPPPPEFDISREKTRATVLVVIAGLIFIGLILPSSIYRAKNSFSTLGRPSKHDMLSMLLSEEIVKFNSVYKIFLYLIVLKSFRNGFVHFFKLAIRKRKEEGSLQETSV